MPIHDFRKSFNGGELAPTMDARVDVEKYAAGCLTMESFIPHVHGPVRKRAGLPFIALQHANTGSAAKLQAFNFTDGYWVLEITVAGGGSSIKVWSSDVASTGPHSGPWADLSGLKFAAVNRIVYVVQPATPVVRLTNTAGALSLASDFTWDYPALLDENVSTTTMAASAVTGSGVTLTASAAYFISSQVGSYFEIAHARETTFAEVKMGDDATKASRVLTFTGNPADGDTFQVQELINGAAVSRTFTFRNSPDAADEVQIDTTAEDTAANLEAAVNIGGRGAGPHKSVELQHLGGARASSTLTVTRLFTDGQTVTAGARKYTYENSGNLNNAGEININGSLLLQLQRLMHAMNGTGVPGTDNDSDYADSTPQNETFEGVSVTETGGGATITTGAFVTGQHYQILNVGDTDFTLIGASANTVGIFFTATGAGGGTTGTATEASVALLIRARQAVPTGNTTLEETSSFASWSALSTGNVVYNIVAREAGTASNALTVTESSTVLTVSGSPLAGGANESSNSSSMVVLGKYEVRSTGRWTGTVFLEKLRGNTGSTWDAVRSWKSENDYNISFDAEERSRTIMRLRFVGWGEPVDNVYPRVILTPIDAYVRGLVKVTGFTSTTQVTVTVINDLLSTAATPAWSEGAWSPRRGYPRAVCFHQNRLWYAGTAHEPGKLWASALGDFENFRIASSDDGAMAFQIASAESQEILWMVSYKRGLVIGSTRGEWSAMPSESQTTLTPSSPPMFTQESTHGSADQQALVFQDSVIFAQRGARKMRKMSYDANGFTTTELTVLAQHITGAGVLSFAVQSNRDSILWAVADQFAGALNQLIGLTFEQDQNVFAWHRHPVALADIESVTVVAGTSGDELWVSANVTGPGRVILRMHPDTANGTDPDDKDQVHMDLAVVRTSATPYTVITGLTHLEGMGVVVWGHRTSDGRLVTQPLLTSGGVQNVYTVTGGQITIDETVNQAWIGVPVVSKLVLTRPEYSLRDGSAQGKTYQVKSAELRLYKASRGLIVWCGVQGAATDEVVKIAEGTVVTDDVYVDVPARHQKSTALSLRHVGAGPVTITGITMQVDIGGTKTS